MGMKKADKAERISRSADQDSSVNAWNLHLKTMREDIDATREGKVRCGAVGWDGMFMQGHAILYFMM